jgi:hypothetical protein
MEGEDLKMAVKGSMNAISIVYSVCAVSLFSFIFLSLHVHVFCFMEIVG